MKASHPRIAKEKRMLDGALQAQGDERNGEFSLNFYEVVFPYMKSSLENGYIVVWLC